MTDLQLSLRLNAEFDRAKAEVAAMRDRLRELGIEVGQTGAKTDRAGAEIGGIAAPARLSREEIAGLAGGWAGLVVSLDPAVGAAMRFEEAQTMVNQAVAAGVTTAEAGQARLEQLAVKLGLADTSSEEAAASAREAGVAFAGLMAGIDPLEGAAQRFAQAQEVVNRAVAAGVVPADQGAAALERYAVKLGLAEDLGERQALEAARLAASWSSLRASLDPAVAAEMRLAEAQAMVNRAVATGVATAAEGKAALDGLALKLGLVEGAADSAAAAQMRLRAHSGQAAAQMGNLASQWNDVVMMALAGQNPLQLAIQQGAQITQSFGNAGAAGAMRMLGASALSLLNPFNLLVIGGLAAGTALVQAFMGAGEKAKTVEEAVGDLETAVGDLKTEAGRDLKALKEDFGDVTPAVRELQRELTAIADATAILSVIDALRTLKSEASGGWLDSLYKTDAKSAADLLGVESSVVVDGNRMINPQVTDFQSALDTAAGARGLDNQIAALSDLKTIYIDAAGGIEGLNFEQLSYLQSIDATEAALRRLAQTQREASNTRIGLERAAGSENDRMGGPLAVDRPKPRNDEDRAEASRMRAELKAEADIQAVIARYGADSWRVTEARVAAERQAYQIALIRLGVGGQELRNDMARWDAAKGIVAEREKLQQTVIEPASAALDRVDQAQAQVAALQQQAELQQLIAEYGEDSLVVALARVAAERQVFEEQQRAAGQSGEMLDLLMEAWDAAEGLASVDIAGRIAEALGPASQLSEYLRQAAGWWGSVQGVLQRASEGGGWVGGIVSRLGLGATPQAPMTSPPPRTRPPGFGVDMDGDGIPDASQTGGGRGGGGAKGESLASIQADARKIMAELDRDIAAIQEKMRAGLIDQSEATEAVRRAKERAAGSIAELIPQLQAMGAGGAAAVEQWRGQLDGLAADLRDTGTDLSKVLSEGFKSPFKEFLKGAADAEGAMNALADVVQDRLADIAAEKLSTGLLEPLMDSLFSGLSLNFSAKGNVVRAGAVVPFADGGAPAAPLSAWANQVVTKPTLFPLDGGAGLMGEAGDEAILPLGGGGVLAMIGGRETRLPLVRGSGGRLGVALPEDGFSVDAVAARLGIDREARDAWRPAALDRPPVPFALGGVISGGNARDVERVRGAVANGPGAAAAEGDGASGSAAPTLNLAVHVEGVPAGHTARVEESGDGHDRVVRVILDQVGAALASDLAVGRGPLAPVLARTYGLGRTPK